MTDRADFTFVAKEYHQRTPWIAAEQLAGDKLVLPGLIGFDLAPGTTFEQAKEIADYMRSTSGEFTTRFDRLSLYLPGPWWAKGAWVVFGIAGKA
jgi:hypothetical protein